MQVEFLGGADEIGRSAVLIDGSLLLDYGMASESPPQYPVGDVDPDAVVVSHGHLDHVGAVPALLSGTEQPTVHWTPPTRELALTLAEDTLKLHGGSPRCPFTENDVRRIGEVSATHGYREPFEAAGYEVTFYNAGHIPGSAHVLVSDGETRLLYTGDFHTDDQRLVSATSDRPAADAVICESTYSDVSHEDRGDVEASFVETLRTTVWQGGTVVVPAFAIGRTQEIMLVCAAHGIDCYVDGMGQRVTEQLRHHPAFLRDADAFRGAVSNARFVDGRDGQRRRIADQNAVVVTTSGMLSGGPAMTYVPAIADRPVNTIAMTGYQVEGTPGRDLLETGSAEIDGRVMPVSAQVEAYDFSAHADREGLLSFLDAYRDSRLLINHGDRCESFARELRDDGHDASAPTLGETVRLS
ncbi:MULTISPECIES: MBL fold metallo-hydrolase [Halomicrobium]|uniref:Beta-lactamase domain protein n=2 Tax=Halomicrobium mukohataei TaxID=57705 RepID=C7NXS7_HALMD|nr:MULTISPECIES: MBL fold metallo-hydrolase [Halomicrobium]ACV46515.1 beta-lactamase domain protein [Halomicrobium mukohataei DSM 12286]QCD67087.1 MBL fold metallo-hydrolase [Halomicrobium mukohataei]QFR21896.1 MBL fold metallo-hydrolase [Halomicrobium sp. ZPS1]